MDGLRGAMLAGSYGLEPVAVVAPGKGFVVLAGERRVAARVQLGERYVSLYVISTWQEFMAWMLLDEKATARARQKYCAPLSDGPIERRHSMVSAARMMIKAMAYLKTTRNDAAQRVIADYLTVPVERARDAKYLLNWLDDPRPEVVKVAQQEVFYVEAGQVAPHSAYVRVQRFADGLNAIPTVQQRRILTGASAQMAGIADALRPLLPLSDELTVEEIDEALRHLSAGRLAAERVIRALKALKESKS